MTYPPSPRTIERAVQWVKDTHANPSAPLDHIIAANVIKHNYPDMFDTPPSKQAKIGETWLANHAIYGELVVYRGNFTTPDDGSGDHWDWATVIDGETDYLTDTLLTLVRKLTDPHSSADETDTIAYSPDNGLIHNLDDMPDMTTLHQYTVITDANNWVFVKNGTNKWAVRDTYGYISDSFSTLSVLNTVKYPVTISTTF